MKKTIFSFLSILISLNMFSLDWQKIKVAWETYQKSPSKKNANKMILCLPDKMVGLQIPANENSAYSDKEIEQIISLISDNVDFLHNRIKKGDNNAFLITAKLIFISDGHFAENLMSIMNDFIKINPKKYLEGLDRFKLFNCQFVNFTEPFEGDDAIPFDEKTLLKERISLILKVKDPNLEFIRDEFIGCLNSYLKELEEAENGLKDKL